MRALDELTCSAIGYFGDGICKSVQRRNTVDGPYFINISQALVVVSMVRGLDGSEQVDWLPELPLLEKETG